MSGNAGFFTTVAHRAWRWLRVIWVCRVPAASAIGGALLMSGIAEARDLFADIGLSWYGWAGFFLLLFVWALLVHSMSRRALLFDDWVAEAHAPGGLNHAERDRLRDQYVEPAIWSARWQKTLHFGPAILVPRLLGVAVFVGVAAALWLTKNNLDQARGLPEAAAAVRHVKILMAVTIAVGLVFFAIVPFSRDLQARLTRKDKEPALLNRAQSVLLLFLTGHWSDLKMIFSARLNQILLLIAVFITLVFLGAVFAPEFVSENIPRAVFLPILLGGGLLLFGELASLSHRFTTPLLLVFFVVGAVLGNALPAHNDVRWIKTASTSPITGKQHQLSFTEAVTRWRADNCDGSTCERPIVIAAAGGASRAGFFAASVVGAMIDAETGNPAIGKIRNRIFAISSVSGGTTGAVMMRAAWMDALEKNTPDTPPCIDKVSSAWFRSASAPLAKADMSWRDCFQQLMAGDFLSPVFVGLAYRDIFPIGSVFTGAKPGDDRSGLLEEAFERWYRRMTVGSARSCTDADHRGLCRRLGHLPDRVDAAKPGVWIPLLFVNGTSVATGRRIIASDVRVGCVIDKDKIDKKRRFLDFSYDYREIREPAFRLAHDGCDDPIGAEPSGIDMRLSTAALMSARFPLISTQGVLRDTDGKIVDSIVDGGYFENDGLATAADIVRELQNQGLHPVVIRIVNEPDAMVADNRQIGPEERIDGRVERVRPPLPSPEDRALFDDLTSIGRALYATRSGHEDGHLAYLRSVLAGPLVRIGVGEVKPGTTALCRSQVSQPTLIRKVSMSWWSSQPVQAYLDAQLCTPQVERLMCVLGLKETDDAKICDR